MSDDLLLSVSGLHRYFMQSDNSIDHLLGAGETVKAVNGASLDIKCGRTLGLIDEPGSGKSATVQSVLRPDKPTKGTVSCDGTDLTALLDREMAEMRKRIQIALQDPASNLNRRKTVGQIIKRPMEIHGLYEDERDVRAGELMGTIGLPPQYSNRCPHELSDGQRQHVGIVHILAVDPDFTITDESISALDVLTQVQILNLLDNLQKEFDLTLLLIVRDLSVIHYVYDRVTVMYLGEIVELMDADELFSNPQHLYTWVLLGAIPQPVSELARQQQVLEGEVPSPLDPSSDYSFSPRYPTTTRECASVGPTLSNVAGATGGHKTACIHVDESETGADVSGTAQGVDERSSIKNFDAEPTLVTNGRGDDDR